MLKTPFDQLPLSIGDEEAQKYRAYLSLLEDWNQRINLVSRKSFDQVFAYHLADSLYLSDFAKEHLGGRAIGDLGSGAGFPGIVFAIRYPSVSIVLFEKLQKRRSFLEAVRSALQLENVTVSAAFGPGPFRGLMMARAVMPPIQLFEFMEPRSTPGARLLIPTASGERARLLVPPSFKRVAGVEYLLPDGAGGREAQIFERCST